MKQFIVVISLILVVSSGYADEIPTEFSDGFTNSEYESERITNDMIAVDNAIVEHFGDADTLRETGYDPFVEVHYDNGYVARNCEQLMEGDVVCY